MSLRIEVSWCLFLLSVCVCVCVFLISITQTQVCNAGAAIWRMKERERERVKWVPKIRCNQLVLMAQCTIGTLICPEILKMNEGEMSFNQGFGTILIGLLASMIERYIIYHIYLSIYCALVQVLCFSI